MRALSLLSGLMLAIAIASPARAADTPVGGDRDSRVRYINYSSDQVSVINVRRGAVTRVVLEPGERIAVAATGFSANCTIDTNEWCIRADVGSNQIWIKPKDNATHNNLELHTDRRDYSLEFRVLADAPSGRSPRARLADEPMYRVIFKYPLTVPLSQALADAQRTGGNRQVTASPTFSTRPELPRPRNWDYTMQVLKKGADIAPGLVFDDGRFTYFQYPGNREIPAVFVVSNDGEEGRVNYHMEDDLIVVHRLSRKFVLRLGDAVVGVFNEAFDAEGVPPRDGTTSSRVVRALRQTQ
ncbi:MAG: TrbG/VirB9 family P-type conjugative transfer protein [Lautropia sp.]